MKITKFEQSGFIIETDKGFKLGLDIGAFTPEEALTGISLDAMLVSHIHGDHFSLPQIKKLAPKELYLNEECIDAAGEEMLTSNIVKVKVGDSREMGGITVSFFDVDHGPNVKVKPKENFGFLIQANGTKIYFGGDIFYPSGIDVSKLEVDYALLPVGGFYTFGPEEAVSFAKRFGRIGTIVPMHFEKAKETRDAFAALAKNAGFTTEIL